MSRFQRVVQAVGSGYVVLAANVAFNLASVPLSLHYLSKREFGLWAVITQVAGFLLLLELGISAGVGRLLFDYKDKASKTGYGETVGTGYFVLILQAACVLAVGYLFAPTLSDLLSIPAESSAEFVRWMRWQCVITAAGFTTRIFWHLLAAHHRYDIANYAQAIAFVVNLALLWALYHLGLKLGALIVTGAASWLLASAASFMACVRLGAFPRWAKWKLSWHRFSEMFAFAKDAFLVILGAQLAMASQTLVTSRHLGLDAAATWAVCTKILTLASVMVWRISDFSAAAFTEMVVRGERERLKERFRTILILTGSLSVFCGILFAFLNGPFVTEWTSGKVSWRLLNNCLLGVWLIVVSVTRCQTGLILLTKEVHFLRFIYLLEGAVFLTISEFMVESGGFPVMLASSIACALMFSGAYGLWRTKNYFGETAKEIIFQWLAPSWKLLAALLLWGGLVWLPLRAAPSLTQLMGYSILMGGAGLYLTLRAGLSRSIQIEITQRAPRRVQALLQRLFGT